VTTSNDDYGIRWTGEGVAYPYPSSRTWSDAERELAEARAEIERLKDQRHELLEHIDKVEDEQEAQGAEIKRLRWQLGQRGARMQIMWSLLDAVDQQFMIDERPEIADWFDADGVPK
jgi:septal ring factor EnvC (AmiA/AmiB activator)